MSSSKWPSAGEYSTLIQNPQNCFDDSELKQSTVKTSRLGLPLSASGNFAVVYQLQNGNRKFAVRCFTRPVTNQQQRYDALSQHLEGFWLPHLVDFAYIPKGIRVRGQWHPIVRMEWAAGKQMRQHVEDHLKQTNALRRLAAQWRGVVAGLNGAHIAHGDLQHGNILVDRQGNIRLVDYDGFFLPSLQSNPPDEVGHPNYQHPERIQKGYYAENADAFSALVIYLSLLALKEDAGLWNTYYSGENLIFSAEDYQKAGKTPIWGKLKRSSDAEVRKLTAALEGFCRAPVSSIPALEELILGTPRKKTPLRVISKSVTQSTPPPPAVSKAVTQPTPPPPAVSKSPKSVTKPTPRPPVVPKPPNPVTQPARRPPVVSKPPKSVTQPAPPQPQSIVCAVCNEVNNPNQIYCWRCGHQIAQNRHCPHCRQATPASPTAKFCAMCGGVL